MADLPRAEFRHGVLHRLGAYKSRFRIQELFRYRSKIFWKVLVVGKVNLLFVCHAAFLILVVDRNVGKIWMSPSPILPCRKRSGGEYAFNAQFVPYSWSYLPLLLPRFQNLLISSAELISTAFRGGAKYFFMVCIVINDAISSTSNGVP